MRRSVFAVLSLFAINILGATECSSTCGTCAPGYLPPSASNECGFFVGANFLWWNVFENDLDYVQKGVGATTMEGRLKYVNYDWEPGFRIYGGYRFPCDGWDARMVYTYIESDDHDQTINTDENTSLDPFLLQPLATPTAFDPDEADASVDLDYGTLDVLVGRSFCVSPTLNMRPYFGFRALWLSKDENVIYKELDVIRKIDWSSDTEGYGLNAGLDCHIKLCKICPGLGLNGECSASILAARAKMHEKQSSDTTLYIDVKEKEMIGLPGCHVGVSLSWDACREGTHVLLSAGYELNFWGDLPQLRRYTRDADESSTITYSEARSCTATNGKIIAHGLTVKGQVDF